MNNGDTITIKTLVSKFKEIFIDARIVGIKRIKKADEIVKSEYIATILGIVIGLVLMIYVFLGTQDIGLFIISYLLIVMPSIIFPSTRRSIIKAIKDI